MGDVVEIPVRRVLEVELPGDLIRQVYAAAEKAGRKPADFVIWALTNALADLL